MTGAAVRGLRNPFRSRTRGAVVVLVLALASPAVEAAEERIEGTVVSTALTACDFKPGTR